jgi:hypothetical protein
VLLWEVFTESMKLEESATMRGIKRKLKIEPKLTLRWVITTTFKKNTRNDPVGRF